MKIGIPREVHEGERRVATTPDVVGQLRKLGFDVSVETNAGAGASFPDDAYEHAGASIIKDTRALWSAADIILKVRGPTQNTALGVHEADLLREGQTLISFLWPAQNPDLLQRLAVRKGNVLAMDSEIGRAHV